MFAPRLLDFQKTKYARHPCPPITLSSLTTPVPPDRPCPLTTPDRPHSKRDEWSRSGSVSAANTRFFVHSGCCPGHQVHVRIADCPDDSDQAGDPHPLHSAGPAVVFGVAPKDLAGLPEHTIVGLLHSFTDGPAPNAVEPERCPGSCSVSGYLKLKVKLTSFSTKRVLSSFRQLYFYRDRTDDCKTVAFI
ncbi:hypothetical protein E5288_WYG008476 [Bos mutus]|uniref:Uncharacterized protein n=1 Tax=Bos mutus TaxID=72004 RepID=A0A6B0S184_9CETA|nr:hypothetical protein [Bos mutus]